jgi:hypothetical protein
MGASARHAVERVARSWSRLGSDQRLAVAAAVVLALTMFLPWYEQKSVGVTGGRLVETSGNLRAFNVFSFVEAAILLVAISVLAMMFLRGERRAFHLPGGDGTVILAAGLWAAFLFFFRLFDKPGGHTTGRLTVTIGIQWGFFVAFLAAGLLAYAGGRMRAAHRPEPPLAAAAPEDPTSPLPPDVAPRPRRRPGARPQAATAGEEIIPGQLSFDEAETQQLKDR